MINENQETAVQSENNGGEGESSNEVVTLKKSEYETLNQTLGSLKRELKDYKKSKTEQQETTTKPNSDELSSLQERLDKQTVRAAGITHDEDIKLARETAKKWGMSIDDIVFDEDFLAKLERQRTNRSNIEATTNVKGNQGGDGSSAKHKAEYWKAKGVPPTPSDIPDKKVRTSIIREMMKDSKVTKKFYND